MEALFNAIVPFVVAYKFWFLFLGALIEGTNTFVVGGFLMSTGSLAIWSTVAIFIVGHTLSGYFWYGVGYLTGANALDQWVRPNAQSRYVLDKIHHYFERYSGRAILVTKVLFSFTIATLVMAGSLRYNLRLFSFYNFVGSCLWVSLTVLIGWFFGESFKFFFEYLASISLAAMLLLLVIVGVVSLSLIVKSLVLKSIFLADKVREVTARVREGINRVIKNGESDQGSGEKES